MLYLAVRRVVPWCGQLTNSLIFENNACRAQLSTYFISLQDSANFGTRAQTVKTFLHLHVAWFWKDSMFAHVRVAHKLLSSLSISIYINISLARSVSLSHSLSLSLSLILSLSLQVVVRTRREVFYFYRSTGSKRSASNTNAKVARENVVFCSLMCLLILRNKLWVHFFGCFVSLFSFCEYYRWYLRFVIILVISIALRSLVGWVSSKI